MAAVKAAPVGAAWAAVVRGNATLEDQKLAAGVIGPDETLLGAWRISEDALSSMMAGRVKCDPKNGKFDCCHTCMCCCPLCWPCAIRDYLNQWNEESSFVGEVGGRCELPHYVYRSQLYLLTNAKFYVHVDEARLEKMDFPTWEQMVTESRIYPRSVSVPLAHIGNAAYPLAHLRAPPQTLNHKGSEFLVLPNPTSLDELMPRKAASTKLYGPMRGDVSPSDSISAMHFAVPCGTMMRPEELQGMVQSVMEVRSKAHAMQVNRWDVSAALTGGIANGATANPDQEYMMTVDADLSHYHSTVADAVLGPRALYRRPHFLMWLWFDDSQFDEALQLITDTVWAAGAGAPAQVKME